MFIAGAEARAHGALARPHRGRGISAQRTAWANEALSFRGGSPPTRLALQLDSSDPQLLANVQTLCVRGYRVEGDEGGTWTTFRELIRDPPAK